MRHLQLGQPCSRGRERGFHPKVRHVTSTHILPANASHMATPDLKGAGVCSFDLAMPQKEENQRTAFLMTTFGLAFPRMLLKHAFRAPSQCTCMKMQRENARGYAIFSCSDMLHFFFAKLYFAISCKIFPRGATVVEILTLPEDSRRTKCTRGGRRGRGEFTIVSICHFHRTCGDATCNPHKRVSTQRVMSLT